MAKLIVDFLRSNKIYSIRFDSTRFDAFNFRSDFILHLSASNVVIIHRKFSIFSIHPSISSNYDHNSIAFRECQDDNYLSILFPNVHLTFRITNEISTNFNGLTLMLVSLSLCCNAARFSFYIWKFQALCCVKGFCLT